MLAPVFKCSTNPRVATAHRWTAVDVIAGMNKPTGEKSLTHEKRTDTQEPSGRMFL